MKKKRKGELTKTERLEISILLNKGHSQRSIAYALGRSPNTISYELTHNSVRDAYNPHKAHAKARKKKKGRRCNYRLIERYPTLKRFIITKLQAHWNPDEISGYIKKHTPKGVPYVSKSAIYSWLRTARGERYCTYLYSQRRYVKRRKKKTERVMIPNRVGIERRMSGANNRSRFGHYESDSVVGRNGTQGGLKVVQERKSRLLDVRLVYSMRPREHLYAEQQMLTDKKTLSVTYDNGIENRHHDKLGVPTFFCNPYHSWEKGGVENVNKMLRRYFPKGTDFSMVTQTQVDRAVMLINDKPRKVLGYRSALEVAMGAGIFIGIINESVLTEG